MNNISPEKIKRFVSKLLDRGESASSIKSRLNSVRSYIIWACQKGIIDQSIFKQTDGTIADYLKRKKFQIEAKSVESPKKSFLPQLPQFGLEYYVGFLITLVFMAVLGAGIYTRFFQKNQQTFAYPTSLTRAGRLLSFQGRLTDSLSNPINTATNVDFKLYNSSSGVTPLYDTNTCSVTPDQDGVFNVLIGGSGYSPPSPQSVCGTEIPANLFSENANVYMGVTIGNDAEMTPRQQIANVGYAINSETLQGFPPGTGTSTIPYINQNGDMLIAVTSPGIRSQFTSSTFTLSSANAMVVQSAGQGDVVLQATESGSIRFRTQGSTNSNNRISITSAGRVGINTDTPASLLDVNGATTLRGNVTQTTGTDSLTLSSSTNAFNVNSGVFNIDTTNSRVGIGTQTPSQTLDVSGNATVSGTLSLGPQTQAYAGTCNASSAGKEYYDGTQNKYFYCNGTSWTNISPIGGSGTLNYIAKWTPDGSNLGNSIIFDNGTNVGIGTTSPTQKLHVESGGIRLGSTSNANNVLDTAAQGSAPSGVLYWGSRQLCDSSNNCAGSITIPWSAITNPVTNLSLNMGSFKTTFTWTGGGIFAFDTNGNVGIGTSSPANKLEVSGNADITGNLGVGTTGPTTPLDVNGASTFRGNITQTTGVDSLTLSSSLTAFNVNAGLFDIDTSNSRVGIGTTAPANKLTVSGNADITGNLGLGTTSPFDRLDVNGSVAIGSLPSSALPQSNSLYVSGNVGIGTTGPAVALEVGGSGNVRIGGLTANTGVYTDANKTLTSTAPTSGTLGYWQRTGTNLAPSTIGDNVGIGTTTPANKFEVSGNADITGNLGIGTTAPSTPLDVNGASTFRGNITQTTGVNALTLSSSPTAFNVNSGLFDIDTTNSRVGIGTTAPTQKLHVEGGGIRLGSTSSTNNVLDTAAQGGAPTGVLFWGSRQLCDTSNNCSSSITIPWSSLTNPVTNLSLNMGSNTTTFTWTGGGIFAFDTNGNVGIGTSSPANKLEVVGNADITGNVGIGTTGPKNKLDVNGSVAIGSLPTSALPQSNSLYVSGNVGIGTTAPGEKLDVNGQIVLANSQYYRSYLNDGVTKGSLLGMDSNNIVNIYSAGAAGIQFKSNTGTDLLRIQNGGNIGIGTTAPTQKLQVEGGGIRLGSTSTANNVLDTLAQGSAPSGVLFWGSRQLCDTSNNCSGSSTIPWSAITNPVTNLALTMGSYTTTFTWTGGGIFAFDTNGNVGIGTSSPVNKLTVSGNADITGNVGIGTTAPKNKLDVAGSVVIGSLPTSALPQSNSLYVSGNVGIGTTGPAVALEVGGSGNVRIGGLTASTGVYTDANKTLTSTAPTSGILGFWQRTGTNLAPSTIGDNVGVGTTAPANKLTVSGNADITGNLGIGTTGPTTPLDINGASTFRGNITQTTGTDALTLSSSPTALNVNAGLFDIDTTNSRVGIGTTAPTQKLQVEGGGIRLGSTSTANNVLDTLAQGSAPSGVLFWGSRQLCDTSNNCSGSSTIPWSAITNPVTNLALTMGSYTTTFTWTGGGIFAFDTNGNVGIGTSSPVNKLTVSGNADITGNVGIGTTTPGGNLEIGKSTTATSGNTFYSLKNNPTYTGTMASSTPVAALYGLYNRVNIGIGGTSPQVTNFFGDYISANVGVGTTTVISNLFNLFIDNPTLNGGSSATNTYALVTQPSAGNIGLGTTSPFNRLDVNGSVAIGSLPSSALPQSNSLYVSGNVGIGTTGPSTKLQVNGALTFGTGTALNAATGDIVGVGKVAFGGVDANGAPRIYSSTGLALQSDTNGIFFNNASGITNMFIANGGNVGIGTTGPSSQLHISGAGAGKATLRLDRQGGWGTTDSYVQWDTGVGVMGWQLGMKSDSTNNLYLFNASNTEVLRVPAGTQNVAIQGNVGIGTTGPAYKLDVSGGTGIVGQFSGRVIGGNAVNTNEFATLGQVTSGGGPWSRTAPNVYLTVSSDNVGIGTSSPAGSLEVGQAVTAASGGTYYQTKLDNTYTGTMSTSTPVTSIYGLYNRANVGIGGTSPQVTNLFENYLSANIGIGTTTVVSNLYGLYIDAPTLNGGSSATNTYALVTQPSAGNVGIGTTSPFDRLDVNGSVAIGSLPSSALPQSNSLYVSGNVGIGTTNPGDKLEVDGVIRQVQGRTWRLGEVDVSSAWGVYDASAGKTRLMVDLNGNVWAGGTANTSPTMAIQASGNVGIGTTGPNTKLEVAGSVRLTGNGSQLQIYNASGTSYSTIGNSGGSGTAELTFGTDSPNVMIIKGSGNVGIGTTGPVSKLVVGGIDNYTNGITIQPGDSSYQNLITAFFDGVNPTTGSALQFQIANNSSGGRATVMTLKGSGNVGIGTTSPANKLEVSGSADITGNLGIGTTNPLDKLDVNGSVAIGSLPTSPLPQSNELYVSGNVGIGTTGPAYKLDVSGGTGIVGQFSGRVIGGNAVNTNEFATLGQVTAGGGPWSRTAPNVYLTVSSDNVGIGTSSPAGSLEVGQAVTATSGNTFYQTKLDNTYTGTMASATPVTSIYGLYNVPNVGIGGTSPQLTNLFVNYAGGNIGIGTTTVVTNLYGMYIDAPTLNGGSSVTNKYALVTQPGAGNVGLGTTSPFDRLDVNGSVAIGSLPSSALPQSNSLYVSGNVGIGTTGPNESLEINGKLRFTGTSQVTLSSGADSIYKNDLTVRNNTSNNQTILRVMPNGTYSTVPASFEFFGTDFLSDHTNFERFSIRAKGSSDTSYLLLTDAGGTGVIRDMELRTGANSGQLYLKSTGNVGIGTTAPADKLEVNGNIRLSGGSNAVAFWNESGAGYAKVDVQSAVNNFGTVFRIFPKGTPGNQPASNLQLFNTDWAANQTNYESLEFRYNNNVAQLLSSAGGSGTVRPIQITTGSNNGFYMDSSGNVGIGTTGPAYKLDVSGGTGIVGQFSGRVIGGNAVNTNEFATLGQVTSGGGPWSRTAPNVYLTVNSDSVGIGTSVPGGSLEVAQAVTTASGGTYYQTKLDNTYTGTMATSTPVSAIYGLYNRPNIGIGGTSPQVTNFFGNYISANVGVGTTTVISNLFNLFIDNPTFNGGSSATNTYALVTQPSAGNIGLGTTTPFDRLDVNGSVAIGSLPSSALPQSNSLYVSGNVGIGTTGPSQLLHVAKANQALIEVQSTGAGSSDTGFTTVSTDRTWNFGQNIGGIGAGKFNFYDVTAGASRVAIDTSGNVGIGTTNPQGLLHVARTSAGIGERLDWNATNNVNTLDFTMYNGNGVMPNANSAYLSYTTNAADFGIRTKTSGAANFLIDSNGNVGIGTISPGGSLEVAQSVTATSGNTFYQTKLDNTYTGTMASSTPVAAIYGLYNRANIGIGGTSPQLTNFFGNYISANVGVGTTTVISNLYNLFIDNPTLNGGSSATNTYALVTQPSAGNVGIGTTAPHGKLDIQGTISDGNGYGLLTIANTNTGGYPNGEDVLISSHPGNAAGGYTSLQIYRSADTNGYIGLDAYRSSVGGAPLVFNYLNGGNVGIGTTAPAVALEVGGSGNVRIGGLTASTGVYTDANKTLTSTAPTSGILGYWNRSGTNLFPSNIGDNVGIGTTAPKDKLDVSGSVAIGSLPSSALPQSNSLYVSGNVGIGITAPNGTNSVVLDIKGAVRADAFYDSASDTYYLDPANGGTSLKTAGTIVLANAGSPTIQGFDGTSWNALILQGSNSSTSTSVCVSFSGESAACSGKIDAGTVDPPYTINGENFATYGPSMTGVKEETTGTVATQNLIPGVGYSYTIDFNSVEKNSDLWLFSKVTDLRNSIDRMVPLLTPSANTKTWYTIDKNNFTLTIFSSSPTTVAYRLTAPRFDASQWNNTRADNIKGFKIDDTGNVQNARPAVATGQPQSPKVVATASQYVYNGNPDFLKQSSNLGNQLYDVMLSAGGVVDQVSTATNAFFGNLQTGLIHTENAVVDNLLAAKNIVAETISSKKIVSPVVETQTIIATDTAELNSVSTNEIKPQNGNITIDLSQNPTPQVTPGALAQIIIKGLQGKTAAVFDAEGNATFAGTLAAKGATISGTLSAENATISGTLVAGNVQSDNINSLTNELTNSQTAIASQSSSINDIQKLLADIKNQPLPNLVNQTNISTTTDLSTLPATPSGTLASTTPTFDSLTVTGQSNLYNVSIAGSLLAGNVMVEGNSILSLASDLRLSSLGTITLFDNAVVIAKDGTITTQGTVVAEGLKIKNAVGEEVAGINASGSAKFNDVTLKQLNINNTYMDATSSAAIISAADNLAQNGINIPAIETATASAGIGVVPENSSEIVVYNSNIKNNSLVYLTPTESIPNRAAGGVGQLTVVKKVTGPKPYFTVSTNSPTPSPIRFNWLIIN